MLVKLSEREEFLGKKIVNAAYLVHKELGPGLLEKIYERCMYHVLMHEGLNVVRQKSVAINFQGIVFEEGVWMDLLIEEKVIVEIKSVEVVNPVWQAQILSQLKLTGLHLGFVINFNVPLIKDGIRRFVK
ncbi:MAG: GxxExxY protein [Chitinophagales bacterium]